MRSTTLSVAFFCLTAAVAGTNVFDARDFSITDVLPPVGSSTTAAASSSSSSDSSATSTPADTSSTPSSTPSSATTSVPSSTTSSSSTESTKTTDSHTLATHTSTTPTSSESRSDSSTTITTAPPSSTFSLVVFTKTQFISGSSVEQTFTSSTPVPASTSAALNTSGDSSSSGLSSSAKNTIIGVVVGVGGAIILAGLAFVAWRVWGKRRDHDHDEDDLMSAGTAVGSNSREKVPGSGSTNTPFKSTLDQYHNPGPVNAASNF